VDEALIRVEAIKTAIAEEMENAEIDVVIVPSAIAVNAS
jgi:hypothetical protein